MRAPGRPGHRTLWIGCEGGSLRLRCALGLESAARDSQPHASIARPLSLATTRRCARSVGVTRQHQSRSDEPPPAKAGVNFAVTDPRRQPLRPPGALNSEAVLPNQALLSATALVSLSWAMLGT